MKTKLFATSNAVLTTANEGEIIAVIVCEAESDVTNILEQAIKEHFVAETVIIHSDDVLTNQECLKFSADLVEEGEHTVRDFVIQIVATYSPEALNENPNGTADYKWN